MAQASAQTVPQTVVSVEHVNFSYQGFEVLRDCSLKVQRGDLLGIIGPNGGGKTTLLKLMLGGLRPTSGVVEVLGRPATNLGPMRGLIGYVPQRETLEWDFPATSLDVVVMGAFGSLGIGRRVHADVRDHARSLLELLGMPEIADRPFGKLSGGQQQRVFVARALIGNPRLLLLDEPTSGIDINGIEAFFSQLRELKRGFDLTVVMVTHDLQHVRHVADRMACVWHSIHWHERAEAVSDQLLAEVGQVCELDAYLDHRNEHHHGQCSEGERREP